jgi:hypothetical protein
MPVYVRTAAGTAAALNPLSKLSRQLRQLLVALDGSMPTSSYAARMSSPNDIGVMLEALLRHGLIREAGQGGVRESHALAGSSPRQTAVAPPAPGNRLGGPAQPEFRTATAISDAEGEAFEPLDVDTLPTAFADDFPSDMDSLTALAGQPLQAGRQGGQGGHRQVSDVILTMSDFVTQHLPDQSLEIVLALESLVTKDQILSSLNDYRALVLPLGDVAHRHLAELQRMLDSL